MLHTDRKRIPLLWVIPGVILALVVLLLLAVNLYLQSQEVQERIRLATAASIGLPVQIGGASYTPWTGLTLSRLEVADPAHPGENLFVARKLNARMALWPLLQKKVVITAIRLVDPILIVPMDSRAMPLPPPRGEVVVVEPPVAPTLEPPGTEGTEAKTQTEKEAPAKPSRPPSYTVEVQNFVIENGGIVVRDWAGSPLLALEEIVLHTRIESNAEQSGNVEIGRVGLANRIFLENFTSAFSRAEGRVKLPQFTSEVAGGKLSGALDYNENESALDLQAGLQGVAVAKLLAEAGFEAGRGAGRLEGKLSLLGPLGRPHELVGEGNFQLFEGRLEPLEFIQQLGQLLRIDELQLLELREAILQVGLQDGEVGVRRLSLLTENLWFRGAGAVNLEGGLNLQANLLINDRLHRNLGGLLGRPFGPSQEAGYREMSFQVGGTLQNPRTNLLDQFAGGKIGAEVGRFLQNLLRPAPPPKKEE